MSRPDGHQVRAGWRVLLAVAVFVLAAGVAPAEEAGMERQQLGTTAVATFALG